MLQGVKSLGVTSSTTLQHLPIDKALEKKLPEHITSRLAFAVQKLGDIVQTAKTASKLSSGDSKLPTVGEPCEHVLYEPCISWGVCAVSAPSFLPLITS